MTHGGRNAADRTSDLGGGGGDSPSVEAGVNGIDTAATYALGHSEEVVARYREPDGGDDRPTVFTECGRVWDSTGHQVATRRRHDPVNLRREVEGSLRRPHRDLALLAAWQPVSDRHATTMGAVVVTWCLAQPAVTTATVGPAARAMATADLTEIADVNHRTGAGHEGR